MQTPTDLRMGVECPKCKTTDPKRFVVTDTNREPRMEWATYEKLRVSYRCECGRKFDWIHVNK